MVLLTVVSAISFAQINSVPQSKPAKIFKKPEKKGILYFDEQSGGVKYKTNGWGFFYRKATNLTYTKKKFWEIEFTKIKHEKESKTESLYSQGGPMTPKGYYFGKQNSLYQIAYRKGYTFVLSEKSIKSGVEIALHTAAGVSLGLLKPYELMLIYGNPASDNIEFKTEKYSSENSKLFLNPSTIYSYGGFWEGIFQTKPIPGASARIGLSIDWATNDDRINALEVGLSLDAFLVNAPLMLQTQNHQVFPALYLEYRIGSKK